MNLHVGTSDGDAFDLGGVDTSYADYSATLSKGEFSFGVSHTDIDNDRPRAFVGWAKTFDLQWCFRTAVVIAISPRRLIRNFSAHSCSGGGNVPEKMTAEKIVSPSSGRGFNMLNFSVLITMDNHISCAVPLRKMTGISTEMVCDFGERNLRAAATAIFVTEPEQIVAGPHK